MKQKKMHGVADPYTLGIVITLLGSLLAYSLKSDSGMPNAKSPVSSAEHSRLNQRWVVEEDV